MKIFSADQLREWDRYTIAHEPIASIDLMERAASVCTDHILSLLPSTLSLVVLAGPGNNGGDGLAMARQLTDKGYKVEVFHPGNNRISDDNRVNLDRWTAKGCIVHDLGAFADVPKDPNSWVIDAIFGTGLNKEPEGMYEAVINAVNNSGLPVISIDIPSGLSADEPKENSSVIQARYTLTFQVMKLAFLLPSGGSRCGEVSVMDIGLHRGYYDQTETTYELTDEEDIRKMIKHRDPFAHKGMFGTALLFAGKKGMMGAAILSATACLRSGVGKMVCRIPGGGLDIMQTSLPEAICLPDENPDCLEHLPPLDGYDAIGIGPGIGQDPATAELLGQLMDHASVPLVLDADALNLIALQEPALQERPLAKRLREGMVITPHVGEFHRLVGRKMGDLERLRACTDLSTQQGICAILKGRYTYLSTASGKGYFNSTGNPGMAKAGSGDVLTGMLTAFLAQKYSIDVACRLAIYFHGASGDLARERFGERGMIASDMTNLIGSAIDRSLLL